MSTETATDPIHAEILRLRGEGLSQEEIARTLGVKRWKVRLVLAGGVAVEGDGKPGPSPDRELLRRRVHDLEKENAGARELSEAIRSAAAKVPSPRVDVRTVRKGDGPLSQTEVDVVFHISDIQYAERVDPEHVPGGNYSPEVFAGDRLPRYLDSAVSILEATALLAPIGTVWIVQGGDMVEGHDVFKGQEWHLAMDAGTQVATLAPLMAGAISTIALSAKALGARSAAVPCVVGNHGKHGGRKAGALPPSLSYDFLTYEMTRHILAGMPGGGGVDWYESHARDAFYFEAQKHIFLVTHGDQDRGGGLIGVPAVTGLRNDMTVRLQTGVDHDFHLVGHYHRPTGITVGGSRRKLWNGDWCGANNLSTGRGGGSDPTQHAYVVHPERGIIMPWPIYLTDGRNKAKPEVFSIAA